MVVWLWPIGRAYPNIHMERMKKIMKDLRLANNSSEIQIM